MARPREFDRDEVLEKAMQVFWARGYERTTVQTLVDAMGINRGSLYDTFGDKDALYQAALEHYCAHQAGRTLARMEAGADSPKGAIAGYLHSVAEAAAGAGRRGCFISNTIAEFGPTNGAIAATARAGVARTESAFLRLIELAQDAGEIGRDRDARALARYLTSSLNGLRMMARAGADRSALDDILSVILATLDR